MSALQMDTRKGTTSDYQAVGEGVELRRPVTEWICVTNV